MWCRSNMDPEGEILYMLNVLCGSIRRSSLSRLIFGGFLFAIISVASAAAVAQTSDPGVLTLDRIFASRDFAPARLGGFSWYNGGNSMVKTEKSATVEGAVDIVSYDVETNKREIVVTAEKLMPAGSKQQISIEGLDFSADGQKLLIYTNSARVWRGNTRGDYFVLDIQSGKLTKLGGDAKPSTLMFAKFSGDGGRVGYVRGNNLYVENLASGKITRLTADGSHTMINGTADWVNEEEFDLRDCWRWSPDGKSIAFLQFDASGIEDFLMLNNTDTPYPKLTRFPYPMAGKQNSAVRAGVISATGGKTSWIKTPGDLRNNYIVSLDWSKDSAEVLVQHMNRLQNTLQLITADPKTGASKTILTETDEAWIDHMQPEIKWLEGGKRFLWMSERDGWKHAYTVARDGSDRKLITTGEYDVISVLGIDDAGGWLYFLASPENATQRFIYRSKLDGSAKAERVSPEDSGGWNNVNVSPNGRWAVQSSSKFGRYSKVAMLDLAKKTVLRPLIDNAPAQGKLDNLKKGPQEFFKIDIGEGVKLDGWMMKPPGFDPAKKYPVLFHTYSGPSGQTVMDMWQGANYLWYLMLTQQGYIVASVDNRGTPAPKGRAWRKVIYKKMGILNPAEQAAAVKAMAAKWSFIDMTRIGMTGASSGGTATLDALFRYPDTYKMGIALCPGADNSHYDTIYTERYMGLPADNAELYKNSASTTHAGGLKGDLLIIHGTGDDNVHYQSTEILMNELIAAGKQFTIMPYPNRTHSISEGEGTIPHMYTLMTNYLNEHLPAGGR